MCSRPMPTSAASPKFGTRSWSIGAATPTSTAATSISPGWPVHPGVIALVTPDGAARQVADGIEFGNGMAVTPDNKTLIVAESFASRLTAFDIAPDGSLTNRRIWAQLADMPPDGICLDEEGAIWAASMARCVRLREGGEVLREVAVRRASSLRLRARRRGAPDPLHHGGGLVRPGTDGRTVQRPHRAGLVRPGGGAGSSRGNNDRQS